jgi:hypothetical protein
MAVRENLCQRTAKGRAENSCLVQPFRVQDCTEAVGEFLDGIRARIARIHNAEFVLQGQGELKSDVVYKLATAQ